MNAPDLPRLSPASRLSLHSRLSLRESSVSADSRLSLRESSVSADSRLSLRESSVSAFSRRRFLAALTAAGCALPASTLGARQLADAKQDTAQRHVPWLDRVQQAPAELPADAPQLPALLPPGAELADWQRRRETVRAEWLKLLGPLATAPRPAPVAWRVLEEDSAAGVRRQLIGYEVEPGVEVQAYLLQPAGKSETRLPGVAVFHSTVNYSIRQPAGIEGQPEKFFGLRLAQRGCVTLSPRNFLWPDNHRIDTRGQMELFQRQHANSLGMARMLRDSQVAVDLLAALPQVDPDRLGAVGHSLGAKEVLYLAAFDERVRVTVSSEGGIGTRFSNWEAAWYLGPGVQQPDFGHEHHELLALAAPRAFLLLGGDSADGDRSWPFIDAALPVYRLYGGRPRVGLWNHKQGHSVPPEAERAIYDWFEAYL